MQSQLTTLSGLRRLWMCMQISLINLYIILYAGWSQVLIPSTSIIPIPQQCYLVVSFIVFIHYFTEQGQIIRVFQSLFIFRRTSIQRVGSGSLKWKGLLMWILSKHRSFYASHGSVIVLLKSIHNASSTPSHLTTSDFSVIRLYKLQQTTIVVMC